jgi:hypothetical protein
MLFYTVINKIMQVEEEEGEDAMLVGDGGEDAGEFAHLYNPNCPANLTCTDDELCKIAKEDAWHDHGDIKGLDPYKTAAKHLNQNPMCEDPIKNEDTFMFDRVLNRDNRNPIFAKPIADISEVVPIANINPLFTRMCDNPNINEINTEIYNDINIQGRYRVFNISSIDLDEAPGGEAPLDEADQPGSLIQALFQCLNIRDDVYFIRDVAYGNFADDIYKWDQTPNGQIATFLITSQGQYDPGPTVTCLTDAGVRIGMGQYLGGSANKPNRETNPNVLFGMYDIDVASERITKYPIYPVVDYPLPIFNNRNSYPPQAMISSKFDCYMVSQIDYSDIADAIGDPVKSISSRNVDTILSSSNTTLFILDPTDEIGKNSFKGKVAAAFGYTPTKNIFTIDKNTSNKATTLNDVTRKISTKISREGIQGFDDLPFDSTAYDFLYTSEEICKILSKKFGDHSQAIKTIDPVISYIEFNCLGNHDTSPDFKISRKKSSGVHVFVTYDRVAATAAIEYGAPVVLFNNHAGFLIYISNKLIEKYSSPETILIAKKQYYIDTYDKFVDSLREHPNLDDISANVIKLEVRVSIIRNHIIAILAHLDSQDITDDQKYADYLKVYYVLSPILSIISGFFNFSTNIKQNIATVNNIQPGENPNEYVIPQISAEIENYTADEKKQWVDTAVTAIKTEFDENDLIYKKYLNCIDSRAKLYSTYKLLIEKLLSIVQKLGVCHLKKHKKNNLSLEEFIRLASFNIEDVLFVLNGRDKIARNDQYSFTYGFIQCFTYINDLIDQGTLTELSKITPTSTLASDRISKLFTACITNSGGAIPSLGIPIMNNIYKTLPENPEYHFPEDKRRDFAAKIHEYVDFMRTRTTDSKMPIYDMIVADFEVNTGFVRNVRRRLDGGLHGGKKTIGFNRTHNKNIHKSNKKTRKNKKIQKNKKLIKGGTVDPIILNRDKLIVFKLFYEYALTRRETYRQKVLEYQQMGSDTSVQNAIAQLEPIIAQLESIKARLPDKVKDILVKPTQFLPKVVLTEAFASDYKVDYLFEGLSDYGKLYYRLSQLVIYIFETLYVGLSYNPPILQFEPIETEITNFIAELRNDFEENDSINAIIYLLINMNNVAKNIEYDVTMRHYAGELCTTLIYSFVSDLSYIPDTDTGNIAEYVRTVKGLLPKDIADGILQRPVPINEIIKKKLNNQIRILQFTPKNAEELLTQLDILPDDAYIRTILSTQFVDMSVGDFTQVLSLGSSDEGSKLLILENYFSEIPEDIDIVFIIYNSRYADIKKAIEYVGVHFGDMFFENYFPIMNRFYRYIRNTEIIPAKIEAIAQINQLQYINQESKTRLIEVIAADNGENIGQLVQEVNLFNLSNEATDRINSLQNIDAQKPIFIGQIQQAGTVGDIDRIVQDATALSGEKTNALDIIHDLQHISDIKDGLADEIIQAGTIDNVRIILNKAMDSSRLNTIKFYARLQINNQFNLTQEQRQEYIDRVDSVDKVGNQEDIVRAETEAVDANFQANPEHPDSKKIPKKKNNDGFNVVVNPPDYYLGPSKRKIPLTTAQRRAQEQLRHSIGGNKTKKNRKQITYKYTKRNTKRLRKTRKITKRAKYIKKNVTKHRR